VPEKTPHDVSVRTERVKRLHAEKGLEIVVGKRQIVGRVEIEREDAIGDAGRLELAGEIGRRSPGIEAHHRDAEVFREEDGGAAFPTGDIENPVPTPEVQAAGDP